MAGLIVDIELLEDRVDLLALEGAPGGVDVPLARSGCRGTASYRRCPCRRRRCAAGQGPSSGSATTHVARLDLVVEQVVEQAHVEHRHRRRQLAVGDDVDAVRRGVDAVRAVRDRDVAGVGRAVAAVEHRHAVHLLEVALLDRLLDPLDVEDDDPVLLLGRHLGQGDALLRVVAGREGVFALVVGIDVVEIAVDHDLPGDLHRVAIDGGEDRSDTAWDRRGSCRRWGAARRPRRCRRRSRCAGTSAAAGRAPSCWFGSSMILSHFMTSRRMRATRRVGLVVHEEVAAVIGAVGEGQVRMVQVAVHDRCRRGSSGIRGSPAAGPRSGSSALVGQAPAGGAAAVEHRNAHQFAHRRQADDAHLAGLAAG